MCDSDRNPCLDFDVNQCGRSYCSADEGYHRGCWLSQGDLENSTIGEWGISGVKVLSRQKYTQHVGHSLVKYLCHHFKSTNILCFYSALHATPEISPSPFALVLRWNTTMIDLLFPVNLSLSLPSLSNLPSPPFFFCGLWIPAECGSVSISGSKTWKFSKGSSAV